MDKALATIAKLNSIAAALSPGTPIAVLAISMAGFFGRIVQDIRNRQQAGEDVTSLLESLELFSDSVDELKAANEAYWTIPQKPVESEEVDSEEEEGA